MANLWNTHTVTVVFSEPGTSDVDMLTYLSDLSRVRIDEAVAATIPPGEPVNGNTSFETDVSGWTTTNLAGSTFTRSTAQAHDGAASGLITPDGVDSFLAVYNDVPTAGPVSEGVEYQATPWVYSPDGYPDARVRIDWRDDTDAVFADSGAVGFNVPAGVWTQIDVTATAPTGAVKGGVRVIMGGTPAAGDLLYFDEAELATPAGTVPAGATRVIERSTDLIRWTTVRGGTEELVDAAALPVNDFEFVANATNHYRIRVFVAGTLHHTFRDSISVVLDAIWLKAVRRPFLNRTVVVVDFGDVQRPGRSGAFDVVGRSLPVAVVDLHSSQRYELQLLADSVAAAGELDLTIASGDVFYIQGPADSPVPPGYYLVGDLTRARPFRTDARRVLTLPLTQVATPHALLEGVTFTWRGLANRYATWQDVMNAHASYRSILDLIGVAGDVIVP